MAEEERELIGDYLTSVSQKKVELRTPERGDKRALCKMAVENAEQAVRQYLSEADRSDSVLAILAERLGLEALPTRIEAYDISNLGAEHKTAGMIVCEDGKLKSSDYRSFSIKGVAGTDDYACMCETMRRRFSHLSDESGSFSQIPDLILLDGGRGHVACVRKALREMELNIPVFGMVKDDFHKTRAITDGEREISIAYEAGVYALIYKIQEEAHRFAVKNSQGAKIRTMTTSSLEKIDGIGPKKARALLSAMPLAKIKNASEKELSEVKGIGQVDARRIYEYYHKIK